MLKYLTFILLFILLLANIGLAKTVSDLDTILAGEKNRRSAANDGKQIGFTLLEIQNVDGTKVKSGAEIDKLCKPDPKEAF